MKTTLSIDINNWNISNITNINDMFHKCTFFDQNISNWNTSNVTSLASLFGKGERVDHIGNISHILSKLK